MLFAGDEAEKQALLLGEPEAFFTTQSYDGWPLVMLRLAQVDAGRLAQLVTDAWQMRAPADIASELDESDGLPGTPSARHLLISSRRPRGPRRSRRRST